MQLRLVRDVVERSCGAALSAYGLLLVIMAGELSSLSCSCAGRPGSAWWRYSFSLRCPISVVRFLAVWFATLVDLGWEGPPAMLSRYFDCP
jgi:hypothetical protein